jgi:hypothetical protein
VIETAFVELDEVDLARSPVSGSVTAAIWLHVGGIDFPARGWDDFALAILAAWSNAAIRLLQGASIQEEVQFMEGPYFVKIGTLPSHAWRLSLVERSQSGNMERSVLVTPAPLVDSILYASDTILKMCRDRGWETADVIRLTESTGRLRSLI